MATMPGCWSFASVRGLAAEARDESRIFRHFDRQDLDGDSPLEHELVGFVNSAHSATSDKLFHTILRQ